MRASKHAVFGLVSGLFCAAGSSGFVQAQDAETDVVTVIMETSAGDFTIELYAERAPVTVENFLRYVDAGAYEGGTIWRVVNPDNDNNPATITVIQGGVHPDFEQFPAISHETTQATGLAHVDGAISMARGDPGTAQAEFFIVIGDNPALDFAGPRNPDNQGFAVFGQVVDGMDVAITINKGDTASDADNAYIQGQILANPVEIRSVTRIDY